MSKIFPVAVAIVGSVSAILCVVMMIMAVRFMELGRVVFYLTLASLCTGITIWGIMNITSKKS